MCILDYSYSSYLWDDEYRYIYPIDVQIWEYAEDDESRIDIGTGRCIYLDVERAIKDEEASPDYFLDVDPGSAAYMGVIYESDGFEFNEQILDLLPNSILSQNLLIIDRLEILPKFRGKKLSVKIIKEMVIRLGKGAGIAALIPYPLQFEDRDTIRKLSATYADLDLQSFTGSQEFCTNKLSKLYLQAGFTPLEGTDLMVMCPDS